MGTTVFNPSDLGVVVVLAGTSASKNALEKVAETLRATGRRVELITGLERTFVQLLRVAFRTGANGRYLIFGGPDLPAATLDKAKKGVEANGVAAPHLWAGEVVWNDEAAAIREVTHRLAAVGVDLPVPGAAATPMAPPPPPTSTNRPPAVTMRVVSPHAPPRPPNSPFPVGPSTPSGMDPTPSGAMAITAPATPPTTDDDDLLRPPPGPFGRMWSSSAGKALVGFATVATLGLAVWAVIPGDEASAEDAKVAAASPTPAAQDEASVAAPQTEPVAEDDAEAEAEAEAAEEDVELPADTEIEEVDAPEESGAVAVPVGDDAELVYAALRNQSIRQVDVLLASPHATKQRGRRTVIATLRWEEANEYCENLVVDGVSGWRLPDVGEAGWLSRANVISRGIYWTATKADAFGTERVVWNVRRKRMTPAGMKWRGGRAICVRFQVPGDGPQ